MQVFVSLMPQNIPYDLQTDFSYALRIYSLQVNKVAFRHHGMQHFVNLLHKVENRSKFCTCFWLHAWHDTLQDTFSACLFLTVADYTHSTLGIRQIILFWREVKRCLIMYRHDTGAYSIHALCLHLSQSVASWVILRLTEIRHTSLGQIHPRC